MLWAYSDPGAVVGSGFNSLIEVESLSMPVNKIWPDPDPVLKILSDPV